LFVQFVTRVLTGRGVRPLAFALILALAACGTTPPPAPAVPEPAAAPEPPPPPPRILTLIAVPDPARFPVIDEAHPAKFFGSVGRLVASADANAKTAEFTGAAQGLKLHLGADVTAALEQALQRGGWVIHRIDVPRDRPDALLADPLAYVGEGEAVLDVAIGSAGYEATTIADPYGPCVTVLARLSSAAAPSAALYTEQISYGSCAFPGYAALPAPPGYRYDSYDDLAGHAAAAVEGLRRAAGTLARRIAPQVNRALP
jgi:hypothetical protein